jgi:hypothetical protein
MRTLPMREGEIHIRFTANRDMRVAERKRKMEVYLVDKKRTMSPTSKERNDILEGGSGEARSVKYGFGREVERGSLALS